MNIHEPQPRFHRFCQTNTYESIRLFLNLQGGVVGGDKLVKDSL
jgi:hypothetical protein